MKKVKEENGEKQKEILEGLEALEDIEASVDALETNVELLEKMVAHMEQNIHRYWIKNYNNKYEQSPSVNLNFNNSPHFKLSPPPGIL